MGDEPQNKLATLGAIKTKREAFELLVNSWLADKTDATIRTYQQDLLDFQRWTNSHTSMEMLEGLFAMEPTAAYMVVDQYRGHLLDKGVAPTTINRRLSVLRSLSRRAVSAGLATAPLLNAGVRGAAPAEETTRQVLPAEWKILVQYLKDRMHTPGTKAEYYARRDIAAFRLLRDVGLRRKEVVTAPPDGIDFDQKTMKIYPKGPKWGIKVQAVDGLAWECLLDWLEIREMDTLFGFTNVGSLNNRLTTISERAGLPHLSPHMFRRTGITGVSDKYGGTTREVQSFARHASPATTARYDKKNKDEYIREAQRYLGEDRED